jgi:hypothetical protein
MLADQIRSKDGPLVSGLFIAPHSGPEPANQPRPLMPRGTARPDHLPHLRLETILLPLSIQDPDQSRAKALRRTSGVRHLRRSAGITPVYHQQTKNLLVSYSPKKLGFF